MKILKILFYAAFVGLLGYGAIGGCSAEKKAEKERLEEAARSPQTSFGSEVNPRSQAFKQSPEDINVYRVQYGSGEEEDVIVIDPKPETGGILAWAKWGWNNFENFAAILALLFIAIEPIVRWTPTEKDNNLLRTLQSWLDRLIPNAKKGGGTFTAYRTEDDVPALGVPPPSKMK